MTTIIKKRTGAEEKRVKSPPRAGLIFVKDELGIALWVQGENHLRQAPHLGVEALIEVPTGKI